MLAYLKLAAIAGAAALCFGAGWSANGWRLGSTISAMKQKQAELVAANHKTEAMWSAHVIKIGEDANAEAERLRAASARAERAAASLHDASQRRAAEASAPTASREAAAATARLLAELHREIDEFAGEAARAAGESRGAGEACVRHDEVTR